MAIDSMDDLEMLVRRALSLADVAGLDEVGLRLDQALIALTGAGIAPEPGWEAALAELSSARSTVTPFPSRIARLIN